MALRQITIGEDSHFVFALIHHLVTAGPIALDSILLYDWQVDKLVVIHDEQSWTSTGSESNRKRVAIVVLRHRDYVFASRDVVRRFRVTLTDYFAVNNNRWPKEPKVEELGDLDQIEVATQKALKSLA